jgi:hypothetical protein
MLLLTPNADMLDIPENYLSVAYQLLEQNGNTILTVMQNGLETVANGKKISRCVQ